MRKDVVRPIGFGGDLKTGHVTSQRQLGRHFGLGMASASLKLKNLGGGGAYSCWKGNRWYSKLRYASTSASVDGEKLGEEAPSSGICRPLSEILKELNKKVPESLVKTRIQDDGFPIRYIPWHVVNRILNLHAPEWSGEVRNITYSADAKSVSVVYRVTLYGTDAEIFRESIGTASVDDTSRGDPVQKAEAMAFRRACARFGLGLHLYHEDAS